MTKVTLAEVSNQLPAELPRRLTLLGNIQPDTISVKGILVGIKSAQAMTRASAVHLGIHGCILLVAKYNVSAEVAVAVGLAALAASWFMFIAFQLSSAACHAVHCSASSQWCKWRYQTYQPVRDRMLLALIASTEMHKHTLLDCGGGILDGCLVSEFSQPLFR